MVMEEEEEEEENNKKKSKLVLLKAVHDFYFWAFGRLNSIEESKDATRRWHSSVHKQSGEFCFSAFSSLLYKRSNNSSLV